MSKQIGNGGNEPASRGAKAAHAAIGTVGAIVAALVAASLTVLEPASVPATQASVSSDAISQQVSPKQIEQYCPAQMNLADTGSYGDSEFQASVGDIASSTRYAAFGSVFHAQTEALGDSDGDDASVLDAADDDADVVLSNGTAQEGGTVFDTRILSAEDGTGAAGALFSWATQGDIEGVSAASCVAVGLNQRLLVPATGNGNTEQLVIANPSDQATSVQINVWGTSGKVAIATSGTIALGASSSKTVDLGAAAANENGLYVEVSSDTTPVAAVVRSIAMDGLTPHGSDFAVPLQEAATTQAMALDEGSASVTLRLFAEDGADASVSWITQDGLKEAGDVQLKGGQVAVKELGDAPEGVRGVLVQADHAVNAQAYAAYDGDGGQRDFALANGVAGLSDSAVALPEHASGAVVLANASQSSVDVTVEAIGADGSVKQTKEQGLDAGHGIRLPLGDLGDDVAAIRVSAPQEALAWGVWATNAEVDKAGLAGVGFLHANELKVNQETVFARADQGIVR